MKKTLLVLACLLGGIRSTQAQSYVTLDVDAGQLRNITGTAEAPVGGLLQLIASPSGTFSAPTSSSYVGGDNILVASFAMNINGGTAETFNALNNLLLTNTSAGAAGTNFTYGSTYALTSNETLELRFYPSLTYAAMPTAPTLGTTYGQVRSSTIEFGSGGNVPAETAWVVPSAGSTVNFEYVTVSNNGTYANTSAYASNTVLAAIVPEPSTYAVLGCGLAGLIGLRMRTRRSAAQA